MNYDDRYFGGVWQAVVYGPVSQNSDFEKDLLNCNCNCLSVTDTRNHAVEADKRIGNVVIGGSRTLSILYSGSVRTISILKAERVCGVGRDTITESCLCCIFIIISRSLIM